MHEDLLVYFRKYEQHLEHYLALCIEQTDPENVHQLRVSIKRMRAVLQFTGQVVGHEDIVAKKQLKSLRKLFKVAGGIRDVQVQLKLIPEYESAMNLRFQQYLAYLEKLERHAVKNFYSFVEDAKPIHKLDSGHELIEKSLALLTDKEIRIGAEQLLASRCMNIRQMLAERPDDKKLHEMRTVIKQMHYIMSIMRKSAPDMVEAPVSLASLTEAEDLLGKWHDMVVGTGFLKNFGEKADFLHESEAEHYKILTKKLESERLKLRRQIKISLGKSFSS